MTMTVPPNGNAPAPVLRRQQATIKDLLESKPIRDKINQVIPKHMDADRLVRVALMAIARTPKLGQCTPASLLDSFMKAAQLGLDCGGPLGSAYLVPYKDQCTLIVGYRGFIELARRSGQIANIQAQVVRAGDEFDFEYGIETVFRHKPLAPASAPILYAWALAKFKEEGVYQLDVMTFDEINAIRHRSRAGDSGPWVTDFAEMAKKTVVRRLAKYLPLSPELADAIETSDRAEFGTDVIDASTIEVPAPKKSKTEQLAERLIEPEPEEAFHDDAPAPEPEDQRPAEEQANTPGRPKAAREPIGAKPEPVNNFQAPAMEFSQSNSMQQLVEYCEGLPGPQLTKAKTKAGLQGPIDGYTEEELRKTAFYAKMSELQAVPAK